MAPPGRRGRVVSPERERVLRRLAELVPCPDRPLLVVVDGADGAGKTILADELAAFLPTSVRASLDDFHHPRAYRHAAGRTGETVWARGFDYSAVRLELLDPWRRGAGSSYRLRWHDLTTDAHVTPADDPPAQVPERGVLLVDGVFAQRPELAGVWDLVIYLDVADDVRVARMAARDGVRAHADHPDQRRYLDAQRLYRSACGPRESADVVVDNAVPERPIVVRESQEGVLAEMPPGAR